MFSGLIAACILMSLDDEVTPSEVIEKLRTVRGPRTIQSVKQYNFVWDYRVMKEEYLKQEEEDQLSR